MFLALLLLAAGPASATEVWSLDFATQSGELVTGGDLGTTWEWGPVASGPGTGFGGATAWATGLSGPHLNDIEEWVELPALPAGGLSSPVVGLTHWYDLDASGDGDFGRVERLEDGVWRTLDPVYGHPVPGGFQGASEGWIQSWFAVEPEETWLRLVVEADTAIAQDGWYLGAVSLHDGDPVPPAVSVTRAPTDTQTLSAGYPVEVRAVDNAAPVSGGVTWSTGLEDATVPLVFSGDFGQAVLPVVEPGTTVTWSVSVTDGVNATTTAPQRFSVFLAAPRGLRGPAHPVAGETALLAWSLPDAPHPVAESRLYRDGAFVARTDLRRARVPLRAGTQTWTVSAVFDTPLGEREGDESGPFEVTALLPEVGSVWPTQGWPGDRLRLEVEGENLLFAQGDVWVDLGDGIALQSLAVRDVDTLVAEVEVEADAAPGERTLAVRSGRREAVLPAALVVQEDADRPRLVSASPPTLERGEQGRIRVVLTDAPASETPAVYLGPGVVVELLGVTGTEIDVMAAIPIDSPVGVNAVEVDDGERIWTGTTFEVRRRPPAVGSTCSTGPSPGDGAAWLFVVVGAVRARTGRRRRPGVPAAGGTHEGVCPRGLLA